MINIANLLDTRYAPTVFHRVRLLRMRRPKVGQLKAVKRVVVLDHVRVFYHRKNITVMEEDGGQVKRVRRVVKVENVLYHLYQRLAGNRLRHGNPKIFVCSQLRRLHHL